MSKTGEMTNDYVETLDLRGLGLPLSKERDLADKIAHIKCLHNDIGDQDPGCNSEVQGRNGMPILNTSQHCCCDWGYIALYSVVWVDWFHEILGYGWLPMVMALIVLVIVLVRWLVFNPAS